MIYLRQLRFRSSRICSSLRIWGRHKLLAHHGPCQDRCILLHTKGKWHHRRFREIRLFCQKMLFLHPMNYLSVSFPILLMVLALALHFFLPIKFRPKFLYFLWMGSHSNYRLLKHYHYFQEDYHHLLPLQIQLFSEFLVCYFVPTTLRVLLVGLFLGFVLLSLLHL